METIFVSVILLAIILGVVLILIAINARRKEHIYIIEQIEKLEAKLNERKINP